LPTSSQARLSSPKSTAHGRRHMKVCPRSKSPCATSAPSARSTSTIPRSPSSHEPSPTALSNSASSACMPNPTPRSFA
jgi:hypothetical protein